MKFYKSIFTLLVSFSFVSCLPGTVNLSSETAIEQLVFCSSFNKDGFQGVLSVQVPDDAYAYEPDSVFLTFFQIPEEFEYRSESYIQIFSINYDETSPHLNKNALTMEVFNTRNRNYSKLTTFIDRDFISKEDSVVNQFFSDYGFEIRDTAGRSALIIGVFNVSDKIISSTQVLIPPFQANPNTYKQEYKNEELVMLHPFYDLMNSNKDDDDLYISKAQEACESI